MRKTISRLFLLLILLPTCPLYAAPPTVIGTNPPNGAVGVNPDFNWIAIKYDQPINAWASRIASHNCFQISSAWSENPVPGDYWWGDRIMIPRDLVAHVPGDPDWSSLPYSTVIDVTINPPGASPDHCFCDQQGDLLPTYHLQFTVQEQADDPPIEPYLVSTDPTDGATGIDPNLSSFSLTFSEPMQKTTKGYSISNWSASVDVSWSEDGRTVTFRREPVPLTAGSDVLVILNPDGYDWFQDLQGNVLQETTYIFKVAGDLEGFYGQAYDMTYEEIPASPANGFSWPYYLGIPKKARGLTTLLVVPNNSGYPCEDQRFHESQAKWRNLYNFSRLASGIGIPILVPTFPRHPYAYLQNLSQVVFQSDSLSASLERIDLQLLAMIQDARQQMATYGLTAEKKIFMTGFSASGQFTSGFAIVHPESIKAAAAGGGNPTAPIGTWNGFELPYMQGTALLEELTGAPFDLNAFKKIPQYFYVGDQDPNFTASPGSFPGSFAECESIYDSLGIESTFKVYPGVGHWISDEAWADVQQFFGNFTPDPSGVWVTVYGSVSVDDQPVCAMVLANGQYTFTCGEGEQFGTYRLDVPLDEKGKIELYGFVSGCMPFKQITDASDLSVDMRMERSNPESRTLSVATRVENGTSIPAGWSRITGTVSFEGTPLCAMVLANGQHMFSCGTQNGIYDLTVPKDDQDQITLYVFVSGFKPYKAIFNP
jgi:dienelactone hydrolase